MSEEHNKPEALQSTNAAQSKLLNDQARYQKYKDFLAAQESKNNYFSENKLGYKGKYQFGIQALDDINFYYPAVGDSQIGKKAWAGEFRIPGYPNVKNINDFLNTPGAQERAIDSYNLKQSQYAASMNLYRYIGKKIPYTNSYLTEECLFSLMHNQGAGGARDIISGKVNVSLHTPRNYEAGIYISQFGSNSPNGSPRIYSSRLSVGVDLGALGVSGGQDMNPEHNHTPTSQHGRIETTNSLKPL